MEIKNPQIDPKSGFNSLTKTFHSLRPPIDLPPEDAPISAVDYAFSLKATSPWRDADSAALIDSVTGVRISYHEFTRRVNSLASYFHNVTKLSRNDTAFVLSTNSIQIPILYFSLFSLGVIISPANPVSTDSEISRQIQLSSPVIAYATSSTAHKLPRLKHRTILIDSPEFDSMTAGSTPNSAHELGRVKATQSDLAAIMYSSGTTGRVKGVMLTHRNLTAAVASSFASSPKRESPAVMLYTMPYFHIYGLLFCLRSVSLMETAVVMERFDSKMMLKAVGDFRVTHAAVTPPIVVSMSKESGLTDGCDLTSLETVLCGAAPLGRDTIEAFTTKFPKVVLAQGYGLTESTAGVFRTAGREESLRWGSTGKLSTGCEAKIVHPETGDPLLPRREGELWIRGPTIMKGYVGETEATLATLLSDGWMRTGDLCYIDEEGFLFVVDRLKDLIKYKGYQVAPAELEQLLLAHPEIADAAVIPYPDEEAGQVPMAFVVRQSQSSLKEAEVMKFVAKQVSPYKKIRQVAFINSIPKSAAGKILRMELRKIAIQAAAAASSRL